MQVICGARFPCGFRVHDRYYAQKNDRFMPGVCARCGGPITIVEDYTETPVENVEMVLTGSTMGELKTNK
jgi:hypothetical protein